MYKILPRALQAHLVSGSPLQGLHLYQVLVLGRLLAVHLSFLLQEALDVLLLLLPVGRRLVRASVLQQGSLDPVEEQTEN